MDCRGDIYSRGILFYELLTGERLFQGGRRLVLLQLLKEDPRPPKKVKEKVPKDLEPICLKAMSKTPNRRYSNASEFEADLRRFQESEAITARPICYGARLWRWSRNYPLAARKRMAKVEPKRFNGWRQFSPERTQSAKISMKTTPSAIRFCSVKRSNSFGKNFASPPGTHSGKSLSRDTNL